MFVAAEELGAETVSLDSIKIGERESGKKTSAGHYHFGPFQVPMPIQLFDFLC